MSETERTDVVRHKVGKCPACRDYLWANVTVVSRTSAPRLSDDDHKPSVYAIANSVAVSLTHYCDNREPAEWEREFLAEQAATPEPPTADANPGCNHPPFPVHDDAAAVDGGAG